MISLISILVILVLTYLSTSIFSKRVRSVVNVIKQIEIGNLNIQFKEPDSFDEIGQIYGSLKLMCHRLSEYIQREYVYYLEKKTSQLRQKDAELKQKNAELYALQSQINPHFLYNTLEIVRMKALINGDAEVGKMVWTLADLFRNSIKGGIVVKISDEVNYCKTFLELYNIRYEGRLKVIFDIDEDIMV